MKRVTTAHADRWPAWSLLGTLALLLLAVLAIVLEKRVWRGTFTLITGETARTNALVLPATRVGGLRVDARADLPTNRWAVFQVRVLDGSNVALLELTKEAWRDSGIWREGGESGRWEESDSGFDWDLRVRTPEEVTIEVALLETGVSDDPEVGLSNETIALGVHPITVPIQLDIRANVLDLRFIGVGLLVSLSLSLMAFYLAGHGGRPVIVEVNDSSEVRGRAVMGGAGHLTTVVVAGQVDFRGRETVEIRVVVRDEAGVDIYDETHRRMVHQLPHESAQRRFNLHLGFELPRSTSWGVFVTAKPGEPVEHLKLVVRDAATSRGAIQLEPIKGGTA